MKNLILHIEQFKTKDFYLDFEEEVETFPVLAEMVQNRECEFLDPLTVSARAFRIRELFEVRGRLQTRVRLTCSRCLKNFESLLRSEFALTYTREAPGLTAESTEEEVELRVEEIGLMYFRGEEIDLRDGIQEQVVMAFPVKPLCDEKCEGLCPTCGADRNQGDCGCEHKPTTGQFAILKNLKLNKK
jgi:DUF177 domain-containing protein